MRARLALASAEINVELREVKLRDKPMAMLSASAKGTVPVIVTTDRMIDESRDIMDWALKQNDPENWLARVDLTLIEDCENRFKDALDKYKYASRYQNSDHIVQRDIGVNYLGELDNILQGQQFLSGTEIGFTDIAIVTFVRQFANVDRGWFDSLNWPYLIKWLDTFLVSSRFGFIMQKYPVWQENNIPIFLLEQK